MKEEDSRPIQQRYIVPNSLKLTAGLGEESFGWRAQRVHGSSFPSLKMTGYGNPHQSDCNVPAQEHWDRDGNATTELLPHLENNGTVLVGREAFASKLTCPKKRMNESDKTVRVPVSQIIKL